MRSCVRRSAPAHRLGYVIQIAATRHVPTRVVRIAVRDLATATPTTGWQPYSAGEEATNAS